MVKDMKCVICASNAVCRFEGKPYCNRHYQLMKQYGVPYGKPRSRTCRYIKDGNVLRVITAKGQIILADASDSEQITKYSWCVSKTGYAVANINNKVTKMHRYILGKECDGKMIDYKNGNPLDNRKINLRLCTARENARNVRAGKNNKLGYLGIRMTPSGKFNVRIVADGIEHHIGNYASIEEALIARKHAEKQYHGEFASHQSRKMD